MIAGMEAGFVLALHVLGWVLGALAVVVPCLIALALGQLILGGIADAVRRSSRAAVARREAEASGRDPMRHRS